MQRPARGKQNVGLRFFGARPPAPSKKRTVKMLLRCVGAGGDARNQHQTSRAHALGKLELAVLLGRAHDLQWRVFPVHSCFVDMELKLLATGADRLGA